MKPFIEVKIQEEALKGKAKADQETKKNLKHSIERCRNFIIYFEEIERELIDRGAKTWAELNPAAAAAQEALKITAPSPQTYGTLPSLASQNVDDSEAFFSMYYKTPSVPLSFFIFRNQPHDDPAPAHTTPLYEALFEACWKGNNERIKELCLPPKTGERNSGIEYLQITCEVRFSPSIPHRKFLDDSVRAEISSFKEYPREVFGAFFVALKDGFTPLYVAILARNWETAKVIIAIAMAQYDALANPFGHDPFGCDPFGRDPFGRDNCDSKLIANVPFHYSFYPPRRVWRRARRRLGYGNCRRYLRSA